jgi:putative ABC transport system permease protein
MQMVAMKFGLYLFMALGNMAQHKLRTFLTLLGLIVGISSVLVMTGMGRGFAVDMEKMLAELLPNKITVQQGYASDLPPPPLTMREATLLQKKVNRTLITALAPRVEIWGLPVKGVDWEVQPVMAIATTADYPKMTKLTFTQGRFFTANEEQNGELVAVVNQSMIDLLQQSGQPNLKVVTIDNKPLQIVGVTENQNGFMSYGDTPQLYLPIYLLQRQLYLQNVTLDQGAVVINYIDVLALDQAHVQQARRDLERILRLYYGLRAEQPTTVQIIVDRDMIGLSENFSRTFTLVLAGIGAIALLVGGIGIMNILLAAVSERTREIGLRKAIGASNRDILVQFLMEAITICLVGGLLGVGSSYGIGALINTLSGPDNMLGIRILIDVTSVFIAAGSSIACGLIFGLYPALRAMRLNPIQALRYE